MKVKKTILHTGVYHSPDREVPVTVERLKHWRDTFARLNADGYAPKVHWGHSDDPNEAAPVHMSMDEERTRSAAGFVESFELSDDGNAATIVLDLPDDIAADKAKKNIVGVSPVILDAFTDGRGKTYQDVIGSIDLTYNPVDNSQTPFTPVATAMSIRMSTSGDLKTYRLSATPEPESKMDDEKKSEEKVDDDAEKLTDEDTTEMSEDGDSDYGGQVLSDLQAAGIAAPDVDPLQDTKGFLLQLCAALKQKAMDSGEASPGDADEPLTVAEPEMAALSLAKKQAGAAHAYAEQQFRQSLKQDISGLLESGRCTPAEAQKQQAAISMQRLSLDSNNRPQVTDSQKWIESRKAVPKGSFWDAEVRTAKLSLSAQEQPTAVTAEETASSAKEYVDKQSERMPGMID